MKIGFIGCGNMATAMLKGILKSGEVAATDMIASAKSDKTRKKIEQELGIQKAYTNAQVVDFADVVFLAVKPQFLEGVLNEIKDSVKEEQIFISIAPGKTLQWLGEHLGEKTKVIRTMPNTPAMVGEGMTALCVNELVTEKETELAVKLCDTFGKTEVIPEHLMESELFGYERGAFAGAMKTKKGLIELAAGGTVFLDEIGELPLSMQTKILTFLDHKKFKRVGGLEDIEVDARVIAATNRNLEHAVKQGEFREDLFYRINVMELVIPPLRDRREDIPALCDYYLKYYNGMFGKNITHVDPDFMRELLLYDWKGNVRELKNIFERCFLFCQGDVLEKHVELKRVDWKDDTRTGEPFALKDLRKGPISLDQEVSMLEQIYMDQALKLCGNNVTKAAALLGITRFSMKRRLDKED